MSNPATQSAFNGILAAVGAAGAVGSFVLLIREGADAKRVAVIAALLVLFVSLGTVGWLAREI